VASRISNRSYLDHLKRGNTQNGLDNTCRNPSEERGGLRGNPRKRIEDGLEESKSCILDSNPWNYYCHHRANSFILVSRVKEREQKH